MDGKFIICLEAPSNTGKTTTLNYVWELLPAFAGEQKIELNPHKEHEIIGFIERANYLRHPMDEKRNRKIGVNSLGDTVNQVREGLAVLIHNKCDIIVCASRLQVDPSGKYGKDIEYMLKEAINTIRDTKLHENRLDYIFENSSKGIKEEDLGKIENEIKQYDVITCSQFSDFLRERICLKERHKQGIPSAIKLPDKDNGVNLCLLSAHNILNLIECLP